MVSFNKVFLVGNLTQDPQLRYTPQGTPVATLRLAANTSFKDKMGELKKETCFINVIVWGQMAETCNQYLQKGKPVLIEGRLQSRSWKDNEGRTRNTIEVRAQRVQFMPWGSRGDGSGPVKSDSQSEEILDLDSVELGGSM